MRFDIPLRESIDFDGEPPSSSRYESVLRQIRRARLACIVLFDVSRGGQSQACRKFSALFSLNFSSSDDDEDEVCSSIK